MSVTRKEFLGSVATVAAGAVGAALLVACGSSSKPAAPDAAATPDAAAKSCTMNGTSATIGTNHGHVLMVSKADVAAGIDITYDITGTATHTHNVTITAALFAMLKNNTTVMVTSTSGGTPAHMHIITVMCI